METDTGNRRQLLPGWMLIDIERRLEQSSIREVGVVDTNGACRISAPDSTHLNEILQRLEQADVIVGHNIRRHDLPELYRCAARTYPPHLTAKICDTLELSNLFLIGKPTHKLSKLYKQEKGLSDPVEDCWESYEIYQTCAALSASLPKLVAHWASRLLPKGYPQQLVDKVTTSLEQQEWHKLQDRYPLLNTQALREYLSELKHTPADIANLGAIVFLNWLCRPDSLPARRPVWLEKETTFHTFQEAEKRAFPTLSPTHLEQELHYFFGPNYQFRAGQFEITQALLRGDTIPLGLLPTGGGKSLTFQLPALIISRYYRGLSIVVVPLQALMQDQVENLRARVPQYADRVAYLSGTQTLHQQKAVIEQVWQGQVDILYLSPERLRQPTIQRLLKHRSPHLWVLDEAHTLSQWGHDFRPDFLRIASLIQTLYLNGQKVRWGFVTATATIKVLDDLSKTIQDHLQPSAGQIERLPLDSHLFQWRPEIKTVIEWVERPAADDVVTSERFQKTVTYLNHPERRGPGKVAIVYTPTRRLAEIYAKALQTLKFAAAAFHSRIGSAQKQDIMQQFKAGELEVVVATNAFGMGIDRPGILTVIHIAPPATPEAYLQEIGRAARNPGEEGIAYLFVDVEADFSWLFTQEMRSQISFQALRRCWDLIRADLNAGNGDAWISALDLAAPLAQDDPDTLATQVRVVLYYLEQATLIREKESCPGLLSICLTRDLQLEDWNTSHPEANHAVLHFLWQLNIRQAGQTVDLDIREVALATALSPAVIVTAIRTFVQSGHASWRYEIAFKFTHKTPKACDTRLEQLQISTTILLEWLHAECPELAADHSLLLHQPLEEHLQQHNRQFQLAAALKVLTQLKLARYQKEGATALRLFLSAKFLASETNLSAWAAQVAPMLTQQWAALTQLKQRLYDVFAQKQWTFSASQLLNLADLDQQAPAAAQTDLLANLDLMQRLGLIRIGRGAAGYDMLYHLQRGQRQNWSENVYQPLEQHYEQRGRRLHAMRTILEAGQSQSQQLILDDLFKLSRHEFNQKYHRLTAFYDPTAEPYEQVLADQLQGSECDFEQKYTEFARLNVLHDYFTLPLTEFDARYLAAITTSEGGFRSPPRIDALLRELSPAQKAVVKDDQSRALLVLAGPGSGKTHTIIRRIAYLILARGVPPEKILALAYNRSAAAELRRRLYQLLGVAGARVDALTFHALAAKLTGLKSTDTPPAIASHARYDWLLQQAIAALADNHPGYQYILVDEYQDVDDLKYQLIRALAGYDLDNEEQKSFLVAVGDDDQNLYEFQGARIEFIHRFSQDYAIRPETTKYLLPNYRSATTLVQFTNQFIATALPPAQRLKHSPSAAVKTAPGQIYFGTYSHPYHAAAWIVEHIATLTATGQNPGDTLQDIAVLAHCWDDLKYLQHQLQAHHIPYQFYSTDDSLRPANSCIGQAIIRRLWAEIQAAPGDAPTNFVPDPVAYLEALRCCPPAYSDQDRAWNALLQAVKPCSGLTKAELVYRLEAARPLHTQGVILSTLHSAKGAEFKYVFVLEAGQWLDGRGGTETVATRARRLYVGFTRATTELVILVNHAVTTQPARSRQQPILTALQLLQAMHNGTTVQALDIAAVPLPPQLQYQWVLEPGDLFLSDAMVINDYSRRRIDTFAQRWGRLHLTPQAATFSSQGLSNDQVSDGVVAVLSKQGKEKLRKYAYCQITATGHTVFRVERDDVWYSRGNYQGDQPFHFVVLPCLTITEPLHP